MKKGIQILAVFILLYSCKSKAQPQQGLLSVQQIQSDYDSLRKALEEAHGGLYRYSTKDEVNRVFDRNRQQLNKPMTTLQFASFIASLLPEFRDGHLRLEFDPGSTSSFSKAKLFPLRVMIDGDRLMVLLNDTPDDRQLQPGMEINSINGHPSADLIKQFMSKISGDGFIETGKRKRVERNFGLLYRICVDADSVFSITAKDATGKTFSAKLNGVFTDDREKNSAGNSINNLIKKNIGSLQGPTENVSLRFISRNIAVLRVKSFGGGNFYDEIDSVFRLVRDNQSKSLILDLRGNGGGVDNYGAYLVAQFMESPFRYFDRIRMRTINPSFTSLRQNSIDDFRNGTVYDGKDGYLLTTKLHSGLGEQAPGKIPFTGRLVVLEDGGTFSTAADVTALLRHLTRAIFIGEESGGSYEGNTSGSSARFIFPNSKLMLNISMYDYYNAVKPANNKGRGTIPDVPVTLTINDLLRGVDSQFEKAIQVASEK